LQVNHWLAWSLMAMFIMMMGILDASGGHAMTLLLHR
jgi:hypothetical protein